MLFDWSDYLNNVRCEPVIRRNAVGNIIIGYVKFEQ